MPRPDRAQFAVPLTALALFVLPMALFLLKFRLDAPFYFLAEDSFYYLSIALHSAHAPFFTIDGLHSTNGFHPLWEWIEFALSHLQFFRLDGPSVLDRFFALDLGIVGVAVALLSAYVFRLTRRPWLSLLAVCPGFLWLLAGVGAPAYLNFWAAVNGMETGVELLFFALVLHLLGTEFRSGARLFVAGAALGLVVLSRLDDVFFLLAIAAVAVLRAPAADRARRLAAFALPVLMIAAYLLYNHVSVGVWMPVSGAAKVGKGYAVNLRAIQKLLEGWPIFAQAPGAVAFNYGNLFALVAQMLVPMAVAAGWLFWTRGRHPSPVLQALALGVLLKGGYNFLRVPISYQGAWYYGASIATANLLLALLAAEALHRWSAAAAAAGQPDPRLRRREVRAALPVVALLCLSFFSFNMIASRATQNGFEPTRNTWLERARIASALRTFTSAPFLEFQDGELSFATGLPSVSGFGLAADPAAVRAQHAGTFFDLLARRGITVAAASNTYPGALAASARSKAVFPLWGFHPQEIQQYCFQPFWSDPQGNTVLYHILHQPVCPPAAPAAAAGAD